jgi:hypothetical protein
VRLRWILLIGFIGWATVLGQMFANRPLTQILISNFVFEDGSYWFRELIWAYGSGAALKNPIFGVGFNEWERPDWMPSSIDNFWLLYAVRHGVPAACLLLLAFLVIFLTVAFKRGLSKKTSDYRTGFLITMAAFYFVAWTVAFWNATYVLFLFLMGSGIWILNTETGGTRQMSRASGPLDRARRGTCPDMHQNSGQGQRASRSPGVMPPDPEPGMPSVGRTRMEFRVVQIEVETSIKKVN